MAGAARRHSYQVDRECRLTSGDVPHSRTLPGNLWASAFPNAWLNGCSALSPVADLLTSDQSACPDVPDTGLPEVKSS